MKDIIPLQNCLDLPLQEKDVGTREKELPSQCPSQRAHQLQDGRHIPDRQHIKVVDNSYQKMHIMHIHEKKPKMPTENSPTFRFRIHSSTQVTTNELPHMLHPIP